MFLGNDSEYVARAGSAVSTDHYSHHRAAMPGAPDNAKHNIPLMGESKIATGDAVFRNKRFLKGVFKRIAADHAGT